MKQLKAFILALVLVVGIQYVFADWTDPSATPPGNNTDAPINVGDTQQQKLGSLFLNTDTSDPYTIGLGVFGQSVFNGPVQVDTTGTYSVPSTLSVGVNGAVGATEYCDQNGNNCVNSSSFLGSSTTNTTSVGFKGFANEKVFNTSGPFVVPSGVDVVMVQAWGAGGGGWITSSFVASGKGGQEVSYGGVGGGGDYVMSIIPVTPGQTIPVTVGVGGGSSDQANVSYAAAGGNSSFLSVLAQGGYPGTSCNNYNSDENLPQDVSIGQVVAISQPCSGNAPLGGSSGAGSESSQGSSIPPTAPGGGGYAKGQAGANGRVTIWY